MDGVEYSSMLSLPSSSLPPLLGAMCCAVPLLLAKLFGSDRNGTDARDAQRRGLVGCSVGLVGWLVSGSSPINVVAGAAAAGSSSSSPSSPSSSSMPLPPLRSSYTALFGWSWCVSLCGDQQQRFELLAHLTQHQQSSNHHHIHIQIYAMSDDDERRTTNEEDGWNAWREYGVDGTNDWLCCAARRSQLLFPP